MLESYVLLLHGIDTMNQKTSYKWSFYRGSNVVNPENKVSDLHLSFSLKSLVNHSPSMRETLDQEREMLACRALNQLGMESFDIAGDQLSWLFVEEGQENYALTRNNSVIALDANGEEFPLEDPKAVNRLRGHLGLPDRRSALRIVANNSDKDSTNTETNNGRKTAINK